MPVEVLLLSLDLDLLDMVRRVCADEGISLKVATDPPEAAEMLKCNRFDGLIADCAGAPGASDVIVGLRKGASNRSAIVFLIRDDAMTIKSSFEIGANFVLDKPVSTERLTRCMRAAHGLLLSERRRYFRVATDIPVELAFSNGSTTSAAITNLSEGGMSIRADAPVPLAESVKISFCLPGSKTKIDAKGEITWTVESNDCAGIHFIYLPDAAQQELLIWLNSEVQRAVLLVNANGPTARTREI